MERKEYKISKVYQRKKGKKMTQNSVTNSNNYNN